MSHSDTLICAYKKLNHIEIKTIKEEGDDGYDSEHTADLTSDDTDEEESAQI